MEEVGLAEVRGRLLCELCSTDPAPGEKRRALMRRMATMVMVMGVVVDWLVVVLEQQMMVMSGARGGSLFQIRTLWRRTRGKLTA